MGNTKNLTFEQGVVVGVLTKQAFQDVYERLSRTGVSSQSHPIQILDALAAGFKDLIEKSSRGAVLHFPDGIPPEAFEEVDVIIGQLTDAGLIHTSR